MKFSPWTVPAVLLLVVAFFSFDAGCGSKSESLTRISGKEFTPEQWIVVPVSDGNGGTVFTTQYHSPVWTLVLEDGTSSSVTQAEYYRFPVGQNVGLTYRLGRWTGLRYAVAVGVTPKLEHQ